MQLYGFHAVMARLRQAPASFKSLYVDRQRDDTRVRDLLKLAQQQQVQITRVEAGRLDRMAGGKRRPSIPTCPRCCGIWKAANGRRSCCCSTV